ncbi:hypothetical protein I350_00537 [Cryptococcus amylolentus CBS 6273]|uniref:Integrase catalytic domain-containing protein n=1 Tax=Cryptococcus amylolentus CBS 6273 TaxID=1296118 RepID=A0A1E3KFS7_9TREE|nr:hypothetical protein I350_00537 [Cryptococcus amylolentus CBS 6273]
MPEGTVTRQRAYHLPHGSIEPLGYSVELGSVNWGKLFDDTSSLEYLKRRSIIEQLSPVYTPQLNGVAERFNRTVGEMIGSLTSDCALGHEYWDEAAVWHAEFHGGVRQRQDGVRELDSPEVEHRQVQAVSKGTFDTPRGLREHLLGFSEDASEWEVRPEATGEEVMSGDVRFLMGLDRKMGVAGLYGLEQSGRAWWLALSEQMEKLGFKRLEEENVHRR